MKEKEKQLFIFFIFVEEIQKVSSRGRLLQISHTHPHATSYTFKKKKIKKLSTHMVGFYLISISIATKYNIQRLRLPLQIRV